jgi:TolA-binding protein
MAERSTRGHRGSLKRLGLGLAVAATGLGASGCGLFASQKDLDVIRQQNDAMAKQVRDQQQDLATLKQELAGTRDRLENALRANADTGTDLLSSKARINDLAGRGDELRHEIEELKKTQQQTRTEIDAKLDALGRQTTTTQQATQTPAAPPVKIPDDKATHFQATNGAFAQKDWALVRTLGHEYVTRYPTDDKADDVQFLIGSADLQDNRPTSALGEFNRLLKVYPRSDKLDKTLFSMGEAYMQLHDCANAKLAFGAAEQRFPKEKTGQDAKARMAALEHPAPGTCAPAP